MTLKFAVFLCIFAIIAMQLPVDAAPGGYRFLRARCEPYYGQGVEKIDGGAVNLCTFPPKYAGITQEDIDAVLDHAQSLDVGA